MPSLQWVCLSYDPLVLEPFIPEFPTALLLPPFHVTSQDFLCIRVGMFSHVAVNRFFMAAWNSRLASRCIRRRLQWVPLLVMLRGQWLCLVLSSWDSLLTATVPAISQQMQNSHFPQSSFLSLYLLGLSQAKLNEFADLAMAKSHLKRGGHPSPVLTPSPPRGDLAP